MKYRECELCGRMKWGYDSDDPTCQCPDNEECPPHIPPDRNNFKLGEKNGNQNHNKKPL